MCSVYVNMEAFLFLLYKTFAVAQLTRDKLGVHQSSMWFQYEHRLQALSQGLTVSFHRQVDLRQSRHRQSPGYLYVSLWRERRGEVMLRNEIYWPVGDWLGLLK